MGEQDRFKTPERSTSERELLAFLLQDDQIEDAPPRVTRRAEPRERAPLSYAQQRLWFLHQFQPELPAYNIASAVRIRGRLNVAALRQTLNEPLRRHEPPAPP